jgi:TRAP-type uncharacterized transport system fused permease subunit
MRTVNQGIKKDVNGEKGYPVIGVVCIIIAVTCVIIGALIYNDLDTGLVPAVLLPILCLANIVLAVIGLYRRDAGKALPLVGLIITISILGFLIFHLCVILGEAGRLFHHIRDWKVPL